MDNKERISISKKKEASTKESAMSFSIKDIRSLPLLQRELCIGSSLSVDLGAIIGTLVPRMCHCRNQDQVHVCPHAFKCGFSHNRFSIKEVKNDNDNWNVAKCQHGHDCTLCNSNCNLSSKDCKGIRVFPRTEGFRALS